jgi:hypothetical protein
MKKLILAAVLVALSGVSSIARAEFNGQPPAAVAQAPASQTTSLAPTPEAGDYAAREAAQPALGDFKGGDAVIYIGGGAVSVLVIVLLIVLLA